MGHRNGCKCWTGRYSGKGKELNRLGFVIGVLNEKRVSLVGIAQYGDCGMG